MQKICSECGARNEAGAGFCVFCNTFLSWDDEPESSGAGVSADQTGQSRGLSPDDSDRAHTEPHVDAPMVVPTAGTSEAPEADGEETPSDTAAGRFQVETKQWDVKLAATGEPTLIQVCISNTSSIVDGYAVETPDAPDWLRVESSQIQLLPGAEETLPLRLQIVSDTLVPTQEVRVTLRFTSLSQTPAYVDLPVAVVVSALEAPVRMNAEPSILRVRDRDSAESVLVIDNSASNRAVHLTFSGSDPELAVQFAFEPPELDVAPAASGLVRVTATATEPDQGQAVSRSLTVAAHEGDRIVETHLTFLQTTTQTVEDPPLGLQVHPSLVRAEDGAPAMVRMVADNRSGTKWAHLKFTATDPEGVVEVVWFPSQLDVGPGRAAQVEAMMEAPPPKAGTEVSRTVTMKAADGPRASTAVVTLVQATSVSPMTTLKLHVEPSTVRVHDVPTANVEVVVDNTLGRSAARISLRGRDSEKAMWFTFASEKVEVAPGQRRTINLRIDSWCPPPGQEATRQFTIGASDGQAEVDALGTLVQTSSRDAMELLSIHLDPSVLHLRSSRHGILDAKVDNRGGAQAVRVSMQGDDPENVVGFTFAPRVLDVPAGTVATTRVRAKLNRGRGAEKVTRPFTIMASDGRADVQAEGKLIQAAAPSYRPLARGVTTLLGGLGIILGALLPWFAVSGRRGTDLNLGTLAEMFGRPLDLNEAAQIVSLGMVFMVLGGLAIFGLTGRTGGLTRLVSLLGVLLLIALFVAFAVVGPGVSPGQGAYVIIVGCVVAYVGGLLRPR